QKPEALAPPVTRFGDRQVTLSWTPPPNQGSAIQFYDLQVSPSAGSTVTVPGSARTYTWTGLANGTAYRFTIRARNKAKQPGDWSVPSAPVVPAGKPAAPGAPSAVPVNDGTGRAVDVT